MGIGRRPRAGMCMARGGYATHSGSQWTPTYFHQDGLGSVVAVTDGAGEATVPHGIMPGELLPDARGIPQYGYTGESPMPRG